MTGAADTGHDEREQAAGAAGGGNDQASAVAGTTRPGQTPPASPGSGGTGFAAIQPPAGSAATPGWGSSPADPWARTTAWGMPPGASQGPGWTAGSGWSGPGAVPMSGRDVRRAERDTRRAQRRADRDAWRRSRSAFGGGLFVGLLLVLVGAYFLVRQLAPSVAVDQYWPYASIAVGLVLVAAAFLVPEA